MPKEQLSNPDRTDDYVLLALKRERCGVDITEYVLCAPTAGCVWHPAPFTAC